MVGFTDVAAPKPRVSRRGSYGRRLRGAVSDALLTAVHCLSLAWRSAFFESLYPDIFLFVSFLLCWFLALKPYVQDVSFNIAKCLFSCCPFFFSMFRFCRTVSGFESVGTGMFPYTCQFPSSIFCHFVWFLAL